MKSRTRHSGPRAAWNFESLLGRYQQDLTELYAGFAAAEGETARCLAAERICQLVVTQCEVEDELLYPESARVSGRHDNRIRAAQLEGAFVRKIVAQIRSLPYDDRRLAGTLDVLRAYIADYLEQQRADVLPRLRQGPQTAVLCEAILQRRAQILAAPASR
jgi:hypothetical protein